jgi:hypothetical protein
MNMSPPVRNPSCHTWLLKLYDAGHTRFSFIRLRTSHCSAGPTYQLRLDVEERLMLFCVASGTDWLRAGIRGAVARTILVLTARGRAVLAVLLSHGGMTCEPRR